MKSLKSEIEYFQANGGVNEDLTPLVSQTFSNSIIIGLSSF